MSNRIIFITAGALILAGCGSGEGETSGADAGGVSLAEAADRARDSQLRPQPGQYEATMEVLEVDIPGAPEGTAEMMRGMMGGTATKYCLTQDDVDKGFESMARKSQDGECQFEHFDVSGGTFDGRMVCNVQGQGSMVMVMKGEGTPTSSTMDITMEGNIGGMGQSTIRMRARHERLGAC